MNKFSSKLKITFLALVINIVTFASTNSNMVWETPTNTIQKSITGPVAKAVALISIAIAGMAWAFTDGGNMMGKAIRIVAALAIVGGAATLVSSVFGVSGGAIIG
jgi:type IV secretion system protein VirB2